MADLFKKITDAGFEFIETLKIDTEGHELEVLRGCSENIRQVLYCTIECFKGIYENSRYAKQENFSAQIAFGNDGYINSATSIINYLIGYNLK